MKHRKSTRTLSILLSLCMMLSMLPITVLAAGRDTSEQETLAAELKELGLFQGTNNGFELERPATRVEALVMLIRVLGKEQEALSGNWNHPFTDVPAWADHYVGYAYENGLTNGSGATIFGTGNVNAAQYLTFILRSLGYSDANGEDFTWDAPETLAKSKGILTERVNTAEFWRADLVTVSHAALTATLKGSTQTLAQKLMAAGVFTQAQFDAAYHASGTGGDAALDDGDADVITALAQGSVPDGLRGTVTVADFCQMLTTVIKTAAPEALGEWNRAAATAMKTTDAITRERAILALYEAACAMGQGEYACGDWQSVNKRWDATGWDWQLSWDYPEWPNWRDVSPFLEVRSEVNYMVGAIHYMKGAVSQKNGKLALEFDMDDPIGWLNGTLDRAEAVTAALRFYESFDQTADSATAAAILAEADARREVILNSETTVSYQGTAYYVSSSTGSDSNNGRSPEKPFKTLARLKSASVNYGDAVFLRRGDIWRGEVLECRKGVTYSAYGQGPKPRLYGAKEDGVGAEKWTLYHEGENGEKIWKFYRDMRETGGVIFNGGDSWAGRVYGWWVAGSGYMQIDDTTKPFTPEACLTEDLTMCCVIDYSGVSYPISVYSLRRTGGLYLRCDAGNPGALYDEVEFEATDTESVHGSELVLCANDCMIDNLSVVYWGMAGIQSVPETQQNTTVQNCEVGWGGNVILFYNSPEPTEDYMITGDGIYGMVGGGTILNNYCHDIDGAGITFEGPEGDGPTTVTAPYTARGNLTERCGQGIWLHDEGDLISYTGKILIQDNMILNTGEGNVHGCWCYRNGLSVTDHLVAESSGVEITGNTVYRSKEWLLYVEPGATVKNNRFYQ